MTMDRRRELIEQTSNPRFTTAEGYIVLPNLGAEAVRRSGTIVISSVKTSQGEQRFFIELNGPAFGLTENDSTTGGSTNFDATLLATYVDDCRAEWHNQIHGTHPRKGWFGGTEQPFLERVAQQKTAFDSISSNLALAGATLFQHIFQQAQGGMPKVAKHVREALSGPPCFITVYSDTFFIPWGMLYVHPAGQSPLQADGKNVHPDGFVGFRHIIEQATDAYSPPAAIVPLEETIAFGFTFDVAIDQDQGIKSVEQQRAYFEKHNRLNPRAERSSKEQLKKAFVDEGLPDQVSYFYLHGRTSNGAVNVPPAFYFGGNAVSANDLKAWSEWDGRQGILPSGPLMLFNACQSGQLRSLFYESFAFKLLDLRARGLLGPQIDIPSAFAQEYAKRFFDRLLASSSAVNRDKTSMDGRVGDIVRTLAQEFRDQENNPLGLVYSLYKGAECYVEWNGTH
jgi:hypothetical protein